jgi:hypothetical protein
MRREQGVRVCKCAPGTQGSPGSLPSPGTGCSPPQGSGSQSGSCYLGEELDMDRIRLQYHSFTLFLCLFLLKPLVITHVLASNLHNCKQRKHPVNLSPTSLSKQRKHPVNLSPTSLSLSACVSHYLLPSLCPLCAYLPAWRRPSPRPHWLQ